MTVWCHLSTIFNRRQVLRLAGLLSLCVALTTTLLFADVARATAGVNETISYQGRLQYASGGVVADGHYNVQFKIYQDGAGTSAGNPGGTLKWTESYINNGGTGGVDVKNGYMTVNLGSVNPFGTSVDWNQDTLWLSMNIAGSATACTTFGTAPCAADGEMLPMQQMTAVPQALNSKAVGGKTVDNLVQMAQGVQTDASTNTSSIFINKTSTGNLLQLQNTAADVFTIGNAGDLTFGSNVDHILSVATSAASTAGHTLTVSGGGGGSGSGSSGGTLSLQGGAAGGTNGNGGSITLDAGAKTGSGTAGSITIGSTNAGTIQIGSTGSAITQNITIGNNNTSGSTTNVTIGAGSSSTAGSTAIQSKDNTTIATNGVTRATFDTSGNLYLGNGIANGSPVGLFAIQATGNSGTGAGTALTVQAGNSGASANGANLTLKGGTGGNGIDGLVTLSTPTFQTYNTGTAYSCSSGPCNVPQSGIDNNSVVVVNAVNAGLTMNLPNPSISNSSAYGRIIYVTGDYGSKDFTLSINGGGGISNLISMRASASATLIWGPGNGGTGSWTVAGASNSTTLQAAYDNTIQSSGGAELIVGKTSNTNGLTIRDSSTNSVNGALFQVQSKTAANLLSINSNVTDYASNPGAETPQDNTHLDQFPSTTWTAQGTGASITRNTTTNNNTIATGQASVTVTTTGSTDSGVKNQIVDPTNSTPTAVALAANNHYNVSFAVRLPVSASIFNDLKVDYSKDGTTSNLTSCATAQTVAINVWTKVNCSFTAPASGITTSNAIFIRQAGATSRVFYVDNLSVTIAADYSLATDGGINDTANFATNWTTTGTGSTVLISTDSNTASNSAQAAVTTGGTFRGVKNNLSINPIKGTRYRISTYAKQATGSFTDFTIRYTRDGGTSYVNCEDYNTQIVTSTWSKITCYINTDSTDASTPQVAFTTAASSNRTFLIDDFSMTLATPTTPNVQIGSGSNGGATTLLTLDRAASAPIAGDNDALLGSMYYDTTVGKLQCYESDGWGSCGSAPDNIITISPEYSNAVMHGTGVGTMTSDICSDFLNINDATNGPQVCGTNETRNFYKWTSPQASQQDYSIYVTYQLPSTFKAFTSSTTSLQAKTDSSNASVAYQVYRSNGNGMTLCGGTTTVATGNVAWQTGTAAAGNDPFTCGFSPGDSIVFKITLSSQSNANAYIGNLGFTFSNK